MSTRPYPEENRFPIQATAGGDEDLPRDNAPTLVSPALQRLIEITAGYGRRFRSSPGSLGQLVVLRGEHGSGKTHAIFYLRREIKAGRLPDPKSSPMPVQLYAKADNPQFLELFQRLLRDLTFETARDTCMKFTAAIAGEQIGRDRNDDTRGLKASDVLRNEPQLLETLFEEATVDRGKVQEMQASEIRGTAGTDSENFRSAVQFLTGQINLAKVAYEWLCGEAITQADARKIGVSGPIQDPEAGRAAVKLFARLFRRAGRPFIFYIDQYENLVVDRDEERARKNVGWIRSLADEIPLENGMLLLSGNEAAYDRSFLDIKTRVNDQNLISLPLYSFKQAEQFVKLYLTPPSEKFEPEPITEDDLFPFTADAVRRMLEYGSGNLRRFLQIAATVMDQAIPDKRIIGSEFVKFVARRGNRLYFDRNSVQAEIEAALLGRTLRFQRNIEFEGIPVDFAVLFPNGSPRLLIRLSKALFSRDESEIALSHLNLIRKIHDTASPTRFLLVVLGYVSPEVTPRLRPFVHELIVYRSDTFSERLAEALDRLPNDNASGSIAGGSSSVVAELNQLREEVDKLRKERVREEAVVQDRAATLRDTHRADLEKRRAAARTEWTKERTEIEQRINNARAERGNVAMGELERLRKISEDARRNTLLAMAIFMAVGTGLLLWLSPVPLNLEGFSHSGVIALAIDIGLIAIYFAQLAFNGIGRSNASRELAAKVSSMAELSQVAHAYLNNRPAFPWRVLSEGLIGALQPLRHRNPQFRYAAALHPKVSLNHLLNAVLSERCALVRHEMARRISIHPNFSSIAGYEMERLGRLPIEDLAYMVEAGEYDLSFKHQKLELLARLKEGLSWLDPSIEEGYERGIEAVLNQFDRVPNRGVRDLARDLSPFETGGLGTFDELLRLIEIDNIYLFLRQILFYDDRQLFAVRQDTTATA